MRESDGRPRGPHPSITVGSEYVVIAIECQPRRGAFYRIIEDATVDRGDTLVVAGLWPAEMFEITSTRISPRWSVKAVSTPRGIHLDIAPETWTWGGFWETVFDPGPDSVRARGDYQREIIALLSEEPEAGTRPAG